MHIFFVENIIRIVLKAHYSSPLSFIYVMDICSDLNE